MTTQRFLFTALICLFALKGYSQPIVISSEDYWRTYTDALIRSRDIQRRHTQTTAWYKAGQLLERWTSGLEKDSEGNSRVRSETLQGKKRTTTESIEINGIGYCRINRGPWRQTADCDSRGANLTSFDGETKESFTKETVSIGSSKLLLLRAYTTIKLIDSSGRQTGRTAFNENKVWISDDNVISKREYVSGFLPKIVEHTVIESYDYQIQVPVIRPPLNS